MAGRPTSTRSDFNALGYVLAGRGVAGKERRPAGEHQLVVFGPGDTLRFGADPRQESRHPNLEIMILGGQPIGEPVVHYGPFVMNSRAEITQAMEDYQAGRLGQVPATELPHRHSGDIDVNQPPAPPALRRALTAINHTIDTYITGARLALAA